MSEDGLKPGEERFPAPAHLDPEARAAQKRRNLWLGLALLAFVILVGVTTMVRLSASDGFREGFYYNMGSSNGGEAKPLPEGMSPEQAAPPPNLAAEPSTPPQEELEQ